MCVCRIWGLSVKWICHEPEIFDLYIVCARLVALYIIYICCWSIHQYLCTTLTLDTHTQSMCSMHNRSIEKLYQNQCVWTALNMLIKHIVWYLAEKRRSGWRGCQRRRWTKSDRQILYMYMYCESQSWFSGMAVHQIFINPANTSKHVERGLEWEKRNIY